MLFLFIFSSTVPFIQFVLIKTGRVSHLQRGEGYFVYGRFCIYILTFTLTTDYDINHAHIYYIYLYILGEHRPIILRLVSGMITKY